MIRLISSFNLDKEPRELSTLQLGLVESRENGLTASACQFKRNKIP